jgi:hypothetical protein
VLIPGFRRQERVPENAAAASVKLIVDVRRRIEPIGLEGSTTGKN